jgi:hypothetical protein
MRVFGGGRQRHGNRVFTDGHEWRPAGGLHPLNPGIKLLVFEECELTARLFEVLNGEVDKLIVCNPTRNAQYKRAKTGQLDAKNLALLLRGGFLTPIRHDGS